MAADPDALIHESIEQLERLSMALADDLERSRADTSLPETKRRRKEALFTINLLIPKLRAASSSVRTEKQYHDRPSHTLPPTSHGA